jgi:hypothetical protein
VGRSSRSQRVDDIDGSPAACTVAFALDGRRYEIDLNDHHAAALREVFAPYIAAARKVDAKRSATVAKAHGVRRRPPVTPAPELAEAPLAEVVPLPHRPESEPDLPDRRRRLVTDFGELTRVFAVAVLATAADRLVGLLAKPAKSTSDGAGDASSAARVE